MQFGVKIIKRQIHFPRDVRKEQIIRETLFLELESNNPITLMMICKQLRTSLNNSMRLILKELADEGLVTVLESVNTRNHPALIYIPNHDAIRLHYGETWYNNVMKGNKHRLE